MTQFVRDNLGQMLHVRFDGRSEELPLGALDLSWHATDEQIKRSLASYFGRSPRYFDDHVVVRHSTVIVVRPEAIYG